jgi:hypothetical protein
VRETAPQVFASQRLTEGAGRPKVLKRLFDDNEMGPAMTVTVEIPDQFAEALAPPGGDVSRVVLEAIALDGYRRNLLGESAVRRLLGFETRMEVHGFLKEHGVYLHYTLDDWEHDKREADRIISLRAAEIHTEDPAG